MKKSKVGSALLKRKCPVCCKDFNAEIVMNTRISESEAAKVEKMHQQVVGYLDKPCKECHQDDCIFLVGIIPELSDKQGVYRSGSIIGIREGAFIEMFQNMETDIMSHAKKHKWVFVAEGVIDNIKLHLNNQNGDDD